jgi:uncharacterized transporter YbjL
MIQKNLLRSISILTLFLLPFLTSAQSAGPEMADDMRRNGKIYIVLACVLLVLSGMIAFLLMMENRLTRLEKENKA